MPVSRVVLVNMGAATLAVGEGLEYIISPSGVFEKVRLLCMSLRSTPIPIKRIITKSGDSAML
jgi:hypothetical protein